MKSADDGAHEGENADDRHDRKGLKSSEIARLAGVARSTVSKVLNGYPNISEETRDRVLKTVERYRYYPNLSAQILAGKRTDTLGLFFISQGHFSEDILVSFMISRVIECAAALGYHMLTYIIRDPGEGGAASAIREVFHQRRVDGGIFIGARNREPIIEELVTEGYVVGVLDQSSRGRSEPNRVIVNFSDQKTASGVVDYLVSLGHREIALIHGDLGRNAGRSKRRGFYNGLLSHSIEISEIYETFSDFTDRGGYLAMKELLERSGFQDCKRNGEDLPITAIAAANDNVAFGAMRAAEEAGVAIPDDISMVGIDGHPLGAHVRPGLTTFRFDFSAMMNSLIQGVIDVIEDSEPKGVRRRVFSATLVERASCRRVASGRR